MKDAYIAAKERWTGKMAGQAHSVARSSDRLPPGQRQVHNFPVLDLGLRPNVPLEEWKLKIHGRVENPVSLSWQQFLALPQFKDVSDFHCVTTWSQFDMAWEGVAFFTIADLVKPKSGA
jgi:DMSO/TMAO reductase YedYZ molybdopterin-dependent catalytic subunit